MLKCMPLYFVCSLIFSFAMPLPAISADWGNLKGRFVFDGAAPERPAFQINKDPAFCGKHQPRAEKLVVQREDRGLANVIFWLDVKPGEKPPIHESYAAAASAKVRIANKGCRFDPHVAVMRVGQTLVIENPDEVAHNTQADFDKNTPFNVITPQAGSIEHRQIKLAERLPAKIQCAIHPWMTGWLVVKDHPYVAVTDEHGRFELKHLPAGQHTFVVWHEVCGFVTEVNRGCQPEEWKRGKVTITIPAAGIDLGDVKISPKLFDSPP